MELTREIAGTRFPVSQCNYATGADKRHCNQRPCPPLPPTEFLLLLLLPPSPRHMVRSPTLYLLSSVPDARLQQEMKMLNGDDGEKWQRNVTEYNSFSLAT
jgi:hypothetical protein